MEFRFATWDEIHCKPIDELLPIAREWMENSFDISVDKKGFFMNDDGTIDVDDGSTRHHLFPTGTAISQLLCKIPKLGFSIPSGYVYQIPPDLAAYNVNRLMRISDGEFTLRCRKRIFDGKTIVRGIVTDRYSPLSHYQVLSEAERLMAEGGFAEARACHMSDDFLRVCTVSNNRDHQVTFKVGDITRFGAEFLNGETGFKQFRARLYCYRLVCKNGLSLPEEFGGISKRHLGDITSCFWEGIKSVEQGIAKVKSVFSTVMNKPAEAIPSSIRNKIAAILLDDQEEKIFGRVSNFFDYVQGVSEAAKGYGEFKRTDLEMAAGELLLVA